MVAVKDLLGAFQIVARTGGCLPGQLEHGVEVGADDTGLSRRAAHLGQPFCLLAQFACALLGQTQLFDLLAVLLCLGRHVLLTQFGLDDLNLLAQIVVLLVFVDCGLDLLLNIALNAQNLGLLGQQTDEEGQTAVDVELFEHFLLDAEVDRDILCDVIGQIAGVAACGDGQCHVGRQTGCKCSVLLKAVLHGAHECLLAALTAERQS